MNKIQNNNNTRIMSLEGSKLLKHNLENKDFKKNYDNSFDNSLLLMKLKKIGLRVNKDNKSKDIICCTFKYSCDLDNGTSYSNEQVREYLYTNGFKIDYYKTDKKGNKSLDETIEYKFFFRTSSQASVGKRIFLRADLIEQARQWLRMEIDIEEGSKCKLVEMLSYDLHSL